ncbi:hypothetical protein JCM18899A_13300 [Nocardioides sp. AN3]
MTGELRDILEERADTVTFQPPDARAIAAAGDLRARRRRRRALTAVAVAAVVVAAGTAVASQVRRPDPAATGGVLVDPVTWSRGSVIHAGPDRVDVGFTIRGFVRTSSGFVLMDPRQSVWSLTDAGRDRVGVVGDQQRLVADRYGTVAAWIDPAFDLVVLDQLTGRTHTYPDPRGAAAGGAVLAMDGPTVYWRNSHGLVTVDATTGAIAPIGSGSVQLFDAKRSVLAFTDATRDLKVGRTLADARPVVAWSLDPHGGDEPVELSPTARWLAVAHIRVTGSGDHPDIDAHLNVYDVRAHTSITLRLPGGPWVAVPSVWLGDATIQVLGLFGDPPFTGDTVDPTMFTCRVPSGSCKRSAVVGRVGVGYSVAALPDGRWAADD